MKLFRKDQRTSESSFPAVRALPTLPPEVILSIIRHSLTPPTSYAAVASRYPLLLIYSQVCRAWHVFAQAELFAHVLLKDVASARRFVLACSGPQSAPGWRAISLRLGQHGVTFRSRKEAQAICEPFTAGLVPGLREAWLEGIAPISLAFFKESTELHTLQLHRCKIIEPFDRAQLYLIPNLRHLSLHQCWLAVANTHDLSLQHDSPVATFIANSLPPLQSFHSRQSFAIESDLQSTPLNFSSCGPAECHTLTIDGQSAAYWTLRLPTYATLARLAFAKFVPADTALDDLVAVLAAVPTELESLRLPHVEEKPLVTIVLANALELLDRDLPCLRKLRRLVYYAAVDEEEAATWARDSADTDLESLPVEHALRKRCGELGIALIERTARIRVWGEDGDLKDDWEEYDQAW